MVETELSRLLQDKRFSAAPQMSAFLRYIVSQTLDGKGDRIKAYTVGVDALGKPPTFDAQSDPSVRVLALRLRKTLVACYESNHSFRARIELRTGTYVPEFFRVQTATKAQTVTTMPSRKEQTQPLPLHQPPKLDNLYRPENVSTQTTVERSVALQSSANARNIDENGPSSVIPSAADATFALGSSSRRWILLSLLFVVLCICLLVGARQTGYTQLLSAGISSLPAGNDVERTAEDSVLSAGRKTPTLYLFDDGSHSLHLRQVSILLGSAMAQSNNIDVVRISPDREPVTSSRGDYHIVLDELHVDSQSRVEAQIVRAQSGVVIISATLLFDNSTAGYSGPEVRRVEELASGLSDASGAVFRDFCLQFESAEPAICQITQVTDPTIMVSEPLASIWRRP